MLALVRFLKSNSWADLADQDKVTALNLSFDVLMDVCHDKGGGASYWRVDFNKPESLSRAVAAYISSQGVIEGVNAALLPMEDVERLGVSAKQTRVPSPDIQFGQTEHYDLKIRNVGQAINLIEIMRKNYHSIIKTNVSRYLIEGISEGRITIGSLNEKLIVNLAKANLLKIQGFSL